MRCIEFIREVIGEYPARLLCGEVQGKANRIRHFYGTERPRLHLPLNFALRHSAWGASSLQATIDPYYNALPKGVVSRSETGARTNVAPRFLRPPTGARCRLRVSDRSLVTSCRKRRPCGAEERGGRA